MVRGEILRITVVVNSKDSKATTNDIASEVATGGGNVVVATVEREVFIFKAPQAGDPPSKSVGFGS
jgi:hypothetical protein